MSAAVSERPVIPSRLSPTALEAYEACPRQFAYHYVERAEGRDRPGPALVVGSAIHAALQLFFGLAGENRTPENLERALRHVWPAHRQDAAFADRAEEAAAGRGAITMLRTWAERADLDAKPLHREEWVRVRLSEQEWFGKVDRIDRRPDGGLVVIDYKTGRRAISARELPTRAAQIYTLAVEEQLGEPVSEFRLDYLALGRAVSWQVDEASRARAREELTALGSEIKGRESFPARPGRVCDWCAYAEICPDRGRTRLEDLDLTDLPFLSQMHRRADTAFRLPPGEQRPATRPRAP